MKAKMLLFIIQEQNQLIVNILQLVCTGEKSSNYNTLIPADLYYIPALFMNRPTIHLSICPVMKEQQALTMISVTVLV